MILKQLSWRNVGNFCVSICVYRLLSTKFKYPLCKLCGLMEMCRNGQGPIWRITWRCVRNLNLSWAKFEILTVLASQLTGPSGVFLSWICFQGKQKYDKFNLIRQSHYFWVLGSFPMWITVHVQYAQFKSILCMIKLPCDWSLCYTNLNI